MLEKDELIEKTMKWYRESSDAIEKAGGIPTFVIDLCSPELLSVLVRNSLCLKYIP